ncbi:AAA family ATPase [Methylorubrum aminovorans]|uniref:AAA family ATPase n=1 Tax=Methylorubrum aminovorans TaxID=269069 RepID=UPI001EE109BC|nr:AAA family ATPase [Methylorubrum aminovorans]GMA79906.1 topology modulation protein [Methylorubrum aminovorans]
MKRINILGNSGSGKSTLARMIGERLQIPVVYLDKMFWEPDWQEADTRVFRQRVARAVSGDAWVCEGNYATKTFDLRIPQADLNVWLDTPRMICATRVILRSMGIKDRPDLPAGCKEGNFRNTLELVRDVWRFEATRRSRVDAELARWAKAETVLHLKEPDQIAKFLTTI